MNAVPRPEAAATAGRSVRRWARPLLIALNVFLALSIVAVGGGYGYVRWRFGQIHRVHIGSGRTGLDEEKTGDPFNLLLVGSDTRELSGPDQERYGATSGATGTAGARSDTIMVLHVDPKTEQAAVLSIPRDTWIPIDGGAKSRINSAFNDKPDGPARLIRTIRDAFGIPINHFAEINLPGFRDMVNAIGGVTVYFAAPARDTHSGLSIPNSGCLNLNGDQALAFVRSRYYEYYEGGRWRTDPDSDLSRIKRQQDFIRRVVHKATSGSTLTSPAALNGLVSAIVKNLTVDDKLTLSDMQTLARRFRTLTPDKIAMMTVPTKPVTIDGSDVLLVDGPATNAVLSVFGSGPLPGSSGTSGGASPTGISVRIQNGTGTGGQGAQAQQQLTDAGFDVASTGNATSSNYQRTSIHYAKGEQAKAETLQGALIGGASLVADPSIKGTDLVLILGRDYEGVRAGAILSGGASATTSSTAGPTVTNPPAAPPTSAPARGTDPSVTC